MFRMVHLSADSMKRIFAVLAVLIPLFPFHPLSTDSTRVARMRRANLEAYYLLIIQPNTDLESFARLAERAAHYGSTDVFIDDLSWLIMGSPDSRLGILAGPLGRGLERVRLATGLTNGYPALLRFGSSGFQSDDKSNQVQHFWFSVILSYHLGSAFPDAMARYHEWNAPGLLDLLPGTGHGRGDAGDLVLSRQAIWLGQALRNGTIQPAEVGDWLRNNL